MKYYSISFPGEFGQDVVETWSEKQILESYWEYWSDRATAHLLRRFPERGVDITQERCIEDWCVIHWAVEVPKPNWITE